jgi:hypothetical protein
MQVTPIFSSDQGSTKFQFEVFTHTHTHTPFVADLTHYFLFLILFCSFHHFSIQLCPVLYYSPLLCNMLESVTSIFIYNTCYLWNFLHLWTSLTYNVSCTVTLIFFQKTILDSIRQEDNTFEGDGYTSLAVIYAVFALCNWLAPSIISISGPRIAMIVGAITYW